jgi:hypothetical protein
MVVLSLEFGRNICQHPSRTLPVFVTLNNVDHSFALVVASLTSRLRRKTGMFTDIIMVTVLLFAYPERTALES